MQTRSSLDNQNKGKETPRRNPGRHCNQTPVSKKSDATISPVSKQQPAAKSTVAAVQLKKHKLPNSPAIVTGKKKPRLSKSPSPQPSSFRRSLKARRPLNHRLSVAETSSMENARIRPYLMTPSPVQRERPTKAKRIPDLNFVATSVKGFWRDDREIKVIVTRDDEEHLTIVRLKALGKQNLDLLVDSMVPHLRTDNLGQGVPQYR
uniref:GAGA-binding transcriptional activator n=1 Tax=Panagrellus redivivus TaxID=6233 RepID=A0A7E4VEV3_PANRE